MQLIASFINQTSHRTLSFECLHWNPAPIHPDRRRAGSRATGQPGSRAGGQPGSRAGGRATGQQGGRAAGRPGGRAAGRALGYNRGHLCSTVYAQEAAIVPVPVPILVPIVVVVVTEAVVA